MAAKQTSNIYNSILSDSKDWMDLTQVHRNGHAFAGKFVQELMNNGQAQEVLETNYESAKKIQYLQNETRNIKRLEGRQVLGVGFPILVATKVSMPLFIWNITLEKLMGKRDVWSVQHEKEAIVRPNPAAIAYLKTAYNFDLQKQWSKLAFEKKVNFQRIVDLLKVLPIAMPEEEKVIKAHQNFPTEYGCMLLRSGVFGLFRTTSFIASDVHLNSPTKEVPQPRYTLGLMSLNPEQEKVYQRLLQQPQTVVDGTADTGKTHLLVHLLSNALFNKKSCLVISKNVPKLKKTQDLLQAQGIEQLHFLLKDGQYDPYLLLELLRTVGNAKKTEFAFDQEAFDFLLERYTRRQKRMSNYHAFTQQELFDGQTWTEIVGRFLHHSQIAEYEHLDSHLQVEDFEFNEQELEQLLETLHSSEQLYEPTLSVRHPIKKLHATVFVSHEKDAALEYAQKILKESLQKARQLHQRYSRKTSNYRSSLQDHYEHHHQQFYQSALSIEDGITDGHNRYGEDFDRVNNRATNSKRNKEIVRQKEQIFDRYERLKKNVDPATFFDFTFLEDASWSVEDIQQNIIEFKVALQDWSMTYEAQIKEEIKRLSSKTVLPDLDYRAQMEEIEYVLEILYEEINEASILAKPLENKNLTLLTRQRHLEKLVEELESLSFHLKDFDLYFDWHKHYLQCSTQEQRMLDALQKAHPPQWEAAFQSWYLQHLLKRYYNSNILLPQEGDLQGYALDGQVLKPLLLRQINKIWQSEQSETLEEFKKQNRKAYNLIFTKKAKNKIPISEVQEAVKKGQKAVSSIVPILLTTPEAAQVLLKDNPQSFDYVIVEESHLIPASEIGNLLTLGKHQIFFGDTSLVHSLEENSIFEEAIAKHISTLSLQRLYGSNQALKAAIFKAKSPEAVSLPSQITIENIAGRFDEEEQYNSAEAEATIRLLNQFKPNKAQQYPRIGITCFTTEQRDLLLSYLERIKQEHGKGRDLILQLERNGLGVFRLDELYGQHFEALIFSATFGSIDREGTLSPSMSVLNRPQGTALVKLLIGRAKKELHILHSIPEEVLDVYRREPTSEGSFLLANFFRYAEAVQKKEKSIQQEILEVFAGQIEPLGENSIFMDEVAAALKPYLEKNRVFRNATVENKNSPLVVQPNEAERQLSTIYGEGIIAEDAPTNYEWEYQQQQHLIAQGIEFLPVWSVLWWKNPKQEARKLASRIIRKKG